jgi:hypothetical protein
VDLRQYFRKLEQIEAAMIEAYQVVVSLETADGGKPGMISEVTRANAAKLLVEGRAVLASEEQKQQFLASQKAAKEAAEQLEAARRLQFAILSEADLARLPGRKNHSQHK